MITDSMFIEPKGRQAMAAALFLRKLPPDVDADFKRSFVHQHFLVSLTEDDAFRKETAKLLD